LYIDRILYSIGARDPAGPLYIRVYIIYLNV
jgi:hypothetical protein